jgi:hypothetical protein
MTTGMVLGFTLLVGFVIVLGLTNRRMHTRRGTATGSDGSAAIDGGGDAGCDSGSGGDCGGGDGGGGGGD